MKRKLIGVGKYLAGVIATGTILLAQAPTYTTTAFDSIQEVADDSSLFFGVIVAVAVIVTGFFLGRRWLRRVG